MALSEAPQGAASKEGGDVSRFHFGAIPARAIGDPRLSGLHFRLLAAVALHDRMSQGTNGQGCWASMSTLARECGANYNNVSSALTELGEFGYVESERHPDDKRRRGVVRVIYTDDDNILAADTSPTGELPDEPSRDGEVTILRPGANDQIDIVRPGANNIDEILRPEILQATDIVEEASPNIFRRNGYEDIPQKRSQNIPSKRVLSKSTNGRSDGSVLAIIQRAIRSPKPIDAETLDGYRETVETILDEAEGGTYVIGWAEKLHSEIDARLAS
jgi:DNA-binding MarR family transcriptional regulator